MVATALVVVLIFSTFSTLTPDEGITAGTPLHWMMRKTYISYCFYFNQRKNKLLQKQ
jgi:hypothetical protein